MTSMGQISTRTISHEQFEGAIPTCVKYKHDCICLKILVSNKAVAIVGEHKIGPGSGPGAELKLEDEGCRRFNTCTLAY